MVCEYCGNNHNGEYGSGRFCKKECARGFSSKLKRKEINIKVSNKLKGRASLFKGIDKRSNTLAIEYRCVKCNKLIKHKSKTGHCRYCYLEYNICSTIMKGKSGGIRLGSGKGKKGYYKGIYCDSTWELAWVIYNLDHNIPFIRNRKGFKYKFKDKIYKYYPDFILEDGTYLEIKGYNTEQWEAKKTQFLEPLIIIDKDTINYYIQYVRTKYTCYNISQLYDIRGYSING